MKQVAFLLLLFAGLSAFCQKTIVLPLKKPAPVKIAWVDSVPGDFSFAQKWSYPDNVELKANGKPGCADGGMCPPRCYRMHDGDGIVLPDSMTAYYSILDTNHIPHSLQCRSSCSEFAGVDFITSYRKGADTVICFSSTDVGTHCDLQLYFFKDNCFAYSHLKSIVLGGDAWYIAISGRLKVDKKRWQNGILKAEFDFQLINEKDSREMIFWKGKIYSLIENSK
jgi:hypothetical protein